MNRKAIAAAVAATLSLANVALAGSKSIELPPDGVPLKPSDLPGYAKAQAVCVACHSAEYMQYQPPGTQRPYWEAMVKRMRQEFNAPVADADIPAIVDYLAKTYGSGQAGQ